MCSFSQAEQGDRFYKTTYGSINLSSLESILSSDIGLPVTDVTLRKPYNPITKFVNDFSNYRTFVMSFVFYDSFHDKSHNMSCDLVIIKDRSKMMTSNCESETALYVSLDHIDIDIRDVGLPLASPPNLFYFEPYH